MLNPEVLVGSEESMYVIEWEVTLIWDMELKVADATFELVPNLLWYWVKRKFYNIRPTIRMRRERGIAMGWWCENFANECDVLFQIFVW